MADERELKALRDRIVGLGERSARKSHYPELRRRLAELDRFRTILDHSGEAILVVCAQTGTIVDANAAAARMVGCSAGELGGEAIGTVLTDAAGAVDAARVAACAAAGGPVRAWLGAQDGRLPVEVSAWDAEFAGEPYLLILARDIGAQLAAERALEAREASLRTVFDSVHDGIVVHDRAGRVLAANTRALAMYGLDADRLAEHTIQDLSAASMRADEVLPGHWSRALAGHDTVVDWRARRPGDGLEFDVEVSLRGCVWYDQTALVAVVRDVTERKRAERERHAIAARLQQAQKMESLGVLAGGIAHDFNNLLMAMLAHTDLLLADAEPDSPAIEDLRGIETAALRAADLCRQMLAYAGLGRMAAEEVDVTTAVDELSGSLRNCVLPPAELRFIAGRGPAIVRVDPAQLRQALTNLVTNASEALGGLPGTITVRCGVRSCLGPELVAPWQTEPLPDGPYVALAVSDSGCGIAPDSLPRVFEPFYSSKFLGRGLGLPAALGIARAHGGTITIDSQEGAGTTVTLLLPAQSRAEPERSAAAADSAPPGQGAVLLVDDEDLVRLAGRRLLERLGYQVLAAASGPEALSLLAEHGETVVCVLLDLTMPAMSGVETLHELRATGSTVPVVLCSGYSEQVATAGLAADDLAGFVAKPFRLPTLAAAVARATGQTVAR